LLANVDFVAQVYRDLLRREADPSGLASFTSALDQGTADRFAVVRAIQNSTEYRTLVVQDVYARFLFRPVDPVGLNTWVPFLAQGGTPLQLEARILGSQEYIARRGGGTGFGFLQALFQDVLGRPPDTAGLASFSQALVFGFGGVPAPAVTGVGTVTTTPFGTPTVIDPITGNTLFGMGSVVNPFLQPFGTGTAVNPFLQPVATGAIVNPFLQPLGTGIFGTQPFGTGTLGAGTGALGTQPFGTTTGVGVFGTLPPGTSPFAVQTFNPSTGLGNVGGTLPPGVLGPFTTTPFGPGSAVNPFNTNPAVTTSTALGPVGVFQQFGPGTGSAALATSQFGPGTGTLATGPFGTGTTFVPLGTTQPVNPVPPTGASPDQVALAVLVSPEATTNDVQEFYTRFLRRPADPAGLNNFVTFIQNANNPNNPQARLGQANEEVLARIIASDEYFARLGG
jgi:hypothetical protein